MASAFGGAKQRAMRWGFCLSMFVAAGFTNSNTAQAESAGDNGIRIGNARLHPFLDFQSSYVMNPGRATSDSRQSDVALTFRPGFNLQLERPSKDLFLDASVEYKHYMGIEAVGTQEYSRLNAAVGLDARFFKLGSSPLRIKADYAHNADPRPQAIDQRRPHDIVSTNFGVDFRPGGGALKVSLDYAPALDIYQDNRSTDPDTGLTSGIDDTAYSTQRHTATFKTLWKFLPKTATFIEANFDGLLYLNDTQTETGATNIDFQVLGFYTGLTGSITEKLGLILRAGYGHSLMAETALVGEETNPGGFLGQVDLQFRQSDNLKFTLGYNRTLGGAALYKYVFNDSIYIESKAKIARKWAMSLKGSVDLLSYGEAEAGIEDGTDARSDTLVRLEAVASVRVTDWFVIALVNKLELLETAYTMTPSGGGVAKSPTYLFNDIFLRMSVRY